MRAEKQRWQLLGACPHPEDISCLINPYFKLRLPHQPCDVLPCSQICFRKPEASDTAFRVPAEPGQLFKRALEALRVDMKRRKVGTLGVPANRAEQQKGEAAKIAHRPDILDVQEGSVNKVLYGRLRGLGECRCSAPDLANPAIMAHRCR